MMDYLLGLSTQPAWIFLAIVLSSYLLEDLAIISAAVMAADQMISVQLAVCAILTGIVSGDIGLYMLGYLLKKHPVFKQWLVKKNRQQHYATLFGHNLIKNILLIRFVPGLRFVCYTSCGLFRAHFGQFVIAVILAGAIWVLVVFALIYQLGSSVWLEHSAWKWILIPVVLMLLVASNRQIMRRIQVQEKRV